jgi:hypothetical protein
MTALDFGSFFLKNLGAFKFSQTLKFCDEFLLTAFSVCRGLVLSVRNLRLSYANHELLYTLSLAVKKSKMLTDKPIR